ncbi:hypothetical protein MYXA107069_13260 [Myxococcus xanthus]|nr:hypothetical protein MyxoNM_16775 [Myxococcus xanthus]SDX82112.1 hypothetical protein SAMN05444383_11381 [Myxococcus xanthus]
MVQIQENWADVRGQVLSWRQQSDVLHHGLLELTVTHVQAVEGFANLSRGIEGSTIRVYVPAEPGQARELAAGDLVSCRIRKTQHARYFSRPGRLEVLRLTDT